MEEKIKNKQTEENGEEKKSDYKVKMYFQGMAFRLDDNVYAMDVMSIDDIIIANKIYRVPNTDIRLLGVLNLRGNILPVYSLKMILGMKDDLKNQDYIDEDEKFVIMIKNEKDIFGVMIDGIYKNIYATEENFKTGRLVERWSKNEIFSGVILEEDKEILVINIENLLSYIVSLK